MRTVDELAGAHIPAEQRRDDDGNEEENTLLEQQLASLQAEVRAIERTTKHHDEEMAEKEAEWQSYLRECEIRDQNERKEAEMKRKRQELLCCADYLTTVLCSGVIAALRQTRVLENVGLPPGLVWEDVQEVFWQAEYTRDEAVLLQASVLQPVVWAIVAEQYKLSAEQWESILVLNGRWQLERTLAYEDGVFLARKANESNSEEIARRLSELAEKEGLIEEPLRQAAVLLARQFIDRS